MPSRFQPQGLPATVIFDLDGTLVDTGPDLTRALNHVMAALDRPPASLAQVRGLVGQGARALIQKGLALSGGGDPALIDQTLPLFLDYYRENVCIDSQPYPGATALLDALIGQGVAIGLCTNKPEGLSRALIDALGWSERLPVIVGGDSLPVRKPDPRHLIETVARAGGDPAATVFVGDSDVDVATARAARVPVLAVSFGFSPVPARDLGADHVIDHYDEALDALARLRP